MKRIVIFILILLSCQASAQLRISTADIDQWIEKNFTGQGVIVGNITHKGNIRSTGTFTTTPGILEISSGLVLSTGASTGVAGRNDKYNQSTAFGSMAPEKDKDLNPLSVENLYDIASVEFDFVPLNNSIVFNYQFGSEEYPEYVNSAYNDIFAFFISDGKTTRNIALIPGKTTPVSINTVNHLRESSYYIDNNVFKQVTTRQAPVQRYTTRYRTFVGRILYDIKRFFTSAPEVKTNTSVQVDPELMKKVNRTIFDNVQFDGITRKLTAQAYVKPYQKYHLKIILADVNDNIYDSGVFIEAGSFTAVRDTLEPGFTNYTQPGGFNAKDVLAGKVTPVPPPTPVAPATPPTPKIPTELVINFDFDSSTISEQELSKLDEFCKLLKTLGPYHLSISGHTDNIGNLEYNKALSDRRNKAVVQQLRLCLPQLPGIKTSENAYLLPAAPNGTEEGRSANRRVEIKIVKTNE